MKRIAMLMMLIIVSIPFVVAQELSVPVFSGEDGADGYARPQDTLTIEAVAKISGEDVIDRTQMRVYLGTPFVFFDACERQGDTTFYECEFTDDVNAYGTHDFKLQLRDDDDNVEKEIEKTLTIDMHSPVITKFLVSSNVTSEQVTVAYAAEDYGTSYGETTECSGIKEIVFSAGDQVIVESADLGECEVADELTFQFTGTGEQTLCMIVTDHLGRESLAECEAVEVDAVPPRISNFSITHPDGYTITHVRSGESVRADVMVQITDAAGVDKATVKANFVKLAPELLDFFRYDKAAGDYYIWENIPVSEVSPCSVQVKATDVLGTLAEQSFDCAISADDTAPEVIDLEQVATKDGKPLYGKGTTLVVQIEDKDNMNNPGIGLSSKEAFMDLSEIGMGSNVRANTCEQKTGALWECSWVLDGDVGEGDYTITLKEVVDDLDNVLEADMPFDIVYDNTPPDDPQLIDFKIISADTGPRTSGGAIPDETVRYVVRSAGFSDARANFSNIRSGAEAIVGDCELLYANDTESASDCTFQSVIEFEGPFTADVQFTFLDEARNKAMLNTTLEVYGTNVTQKDYWAASITECTPTVDRSTASIVNQYVACKIKLESPNPHVAPLSVLGPSTPDDCLGDMTDVNDLYIINNGEGSEEPYIMMKLEVTDYYVDQLNITCPLDVMTKFEKQTSTGTEIFVTQQPEHEEVNLTIEFYDQPLGSLAKAMDQKVVDAFNAGIADWEFLGDLQQFMTYGERICRMRSIGGGIISGLSIATNLFKNIAFGLKAVPVTKQAGWTADLAAANVCDTEEGISEVWEKADEYLGAICSMINCGASRTEALGGVPDALSGRADILGFCSGTKKFFDSLNVIDLVDEGFTEDYFEGRGLDLQGVQAQKNNVKDSLLLSTMCLCVPGIIYNLEKLRQVHCFKGVCLNDYVKERGYPVTFCEETADFLECQFVVGELWNLMPFSQIFDQVANFVLDLISNPVAGFQLAIGAACQFACPAGADPWAYAACAIPKALAIVGEASAEMSAMSDANRNYWRPVNDQYCGRLEQIKEEIGR